MHHWNTRFVEDGTTHEDYLVIRHPMPNFKNTDVFGIKFCGGYAVVRKNSKDYYKIKRIPIFKKAKEFSLDFLKKAGFRSRDIQMIFGRNIFVHYMASLGLTPQGQPLPKVEDPIEDETLTEEKSVEATKTSNSIEEPKTELETGLLESMNDAIEHAKEEKVPVKKPKRKRGRPRKKKSLEIMVNNEELAKEE